ncbi:MAG: RsmD family RNA methyltransferase [Gemmatimonadales bacterium]
MRIIAGKHAGRHLTSPGKRIRPTAESVRDRWLGRLAGELEGARVLDLFAGSGALGLEALSRGAASADFVENGPEALHALKANVAALRETKRARIFKRDAIPFTEALGEGRYDIAFVDAPYGSKKLDRILHTWADCPFARILGVEHGRDQVLPLLKLRGRTRFSGETGVTIYRASVARADVPSESIGKAASPPLQR